MAMDRWNPLREVLTLREAMDRLLEESFVRPSGGAPKAAGFPVNVLERDEQYVVTASVPGVAPDNLQITIQGETLTIKGEPHKDEERSGDRWIVHEQHAGTFQRAIALPSPVAAERAEAHFENGVLTLSLPKEQKAGPRQIPLGRRSQQSPPSPETAASPSIVDPTKVQGTPGGGLAQSQDPAQAEHASARDAVMKESEASFPASDPPSWTPERA